MGVKKKGDWGRSLLVTDWAKGNNFPGEGKRRRRSSCSHLHLWEKKGVLHLSRKRDRGGEGPERPRCLYL